MCEICRHAPKNDHVCAEHYGKNIFSFEIFLFATKASTLTNDQTFYHPREAALELRIEIIEKLLRFQVYAAKSLLFRPCAFPSVLLIASLFSRVPPFSFPHSNFHYSEHFAWNCNCLSPGFTETHFSCKPTKDNIKSIAPSGWS